MEKSKRYMEDSEDNYNKGYYDLSTFSLHQSIELFLKGVLLLKEGDFPHTHNIRNLMEDLKIGGNIKCVNAINGYINKYGIELSLISNAYIASRYFESDYNNNDVLKLIKIIKEIKEGIEDVCGNI
jgi:HEPN domain-containing protein